MSHAEMSEQGKLGLRKFIIRSSLKALSSSEEITMPMKAGRHSSPMKILNKIS
jgi:hypothetical protein